MIPGVSQGTGEPVRIDVVGPLAVAVGSRVLRGSEIGSRKGRQVLAILRARLPDDPVASEVAAGAEDEIECCAASWTTTPTSSSSSSRTADPLRMPSSCGAAPPEAWLADCALSATRHSGW